MMVLPRPNSIPSGFPCLGVAFCGRRVFRRAVAAFSLVEVSIALGVFALGIVSVFGLLPIGLQLSRESARQLVEGNILQQISNDAQVTDFATLTGSSYSPTYYFDDQGILLSGPAKKFYTVTGQVYPTMNIPSTSTPAPSATDGLVWNSMAVMKLLIQSPSGTSTRFIYIAKLAN